MKILVFNVGSTTLKYASIDSQSGERLTKGLIDRIGQLGGDATDHLSAAKSVLAKHDLSQIDAIAHRVVQGADRFSKPTLVDNNTLSELAKLDDLAPLHNPPARVVIEALCHEIGMIPQFMVFDSAFFSTLPPKAYRYAVPDEIFQHHHVRRYGAHGTSHQYVTRRCIDWLKDNGLSTSDSLRVISLHLGGGASVSASVNGTAIETSMGMTPLEGLVMATRSGDIDPAVVFHLARTAKMSMEEIDRLLNKQSGLKGLCGDVDMRTILQRRDVGDPAAILAIEIYIHRIQKYLGAYFAILGGLDAVVFTAGVGENAVAIRDEVCRSLGHMGIEIDPLANGRRNQTPGVLCISPPTTATKVLVIPTDEEMAIAKQVESIARDAKST